MTNCEAAEYAAAVQALQPHGVSLPVAADSLAQCLNSTKTLTQLLEAAAFWSSNNRTVARAWGSSKPTVFNVIKIHFMK